MKYTIIGFIAFVMYSFFSPSGTEVKALISSLNPAQKEKALYSLEDEKRSDWHYLPAGSYKRPGIKLSELNDAQKTNVHALLKSALSETGYEKTLAIIDLENVLAELENNYTHRDPDQYALAVFGDPDKSDMWSWSFSGHHISLHFTYVDGKISMSPRFFGSNPAILKEGKHKGLSVLHLEEHGGLNLVNSLSEEQREKAIFQDEAYMEVQTTNMPEVEPLAKEGILAKELTNAQNVALKDLVLLYLSSIPENLAKERYKKIEVENFDEILFAWAGATELEKPHYYRVQGKSFLIEFDNAQNNTNHVHTVWRDFDGDFGRDLIREHRAAQKH